MRAQRRVQDLAWGPVSYLEWAPVGRPVSSTLLLLHGGGLDSAELSWGEVGPALARAGHRVIAPDHPGYGESPLAPWVSSQDRLVEYVGEFADALRLDGYSLGGLSLGGGMAIGHVLRRPSGVRGVMLLGSYGLMDRQFDGWYAGPAHVVTWMMLRTGALAAVMKAYGRSRKLMESSLSTIIGNPEQRTPELLDSIMAAAQRGEGLASFGQWQRDQFRWNRLKTNYADRLGSLPQPVLVIHGDRDSGVPVVYAEEAARLLPDGRLVVVEDAGHWVQRDRPDIVLPAMSDFLWGLG